MRAVLHLTPDLRARLESLTAAMYPREACGLLVGLAAPGLARVERVHALSNVEVARAHDRYRLDPDEQLRVESAARRQGLDVVGIWHSHPDHPARPSETDRAAAWEGWSYVIASVSPRGVSDLRSWRLSGEGFEEEEIIDGND